jgi:hypothetical protein
MNKGFDERFISFIGAKPARSRLSEPIQWSREKNLHCAPTQPTGNPLGIYWMAARKASLSVARR